MGKSVVRDWYLSVDSNDLSNRVRSISVDQPIDELESTTMGAPVKEYEPGLGDFSLNVTFVMDRATNSVWSTLLDIFSDPDTAVTVIWRPIRSEPPHANNPEQSMQAKMFNFPYGGTVGELEELEVTFRNAGDSGITTTTTSY